MHKLAQVQAVLPGLPTLVNAAASTPLVFLFFWTPWMMCLMSSWDGMAEGAFSAAGVAPSSRAALLEQGLLAHQPLISEGMKQGAQESISQSQRPWNRLDTNLGRQTEVHFILKSSVANGETANLPLESLSWEYASTHHASISLSCFQTNLLLNPPELPSWPQK